jgi:histidinol-phosphate aminotransferase
MEFNRALESIKSYEAGKPIELVVREFGIDRGDVVKLASNENPNGCSKRVSEAIAKNANMASLYPDDSFYELKEGLSQRFNIEESNIIIGAGSDQILELISRALLNEKRAVLMTKVTFAMYEIYALQMGAKVIRTPSYQHKKEEILEYYNRYNPKIIYLCTPNNPTGDAIEREDIFEIIDGVDEDTLVVVDGAYMEYAKAKDSAYSIEPKDILRYPNVIYTGTLSKAYGLGGMRVGYGIADKSLIRELHKLRPPFNITTLSLVGAVEALRDREFVERSIELHQQELKRYEIFAKEFGFRYIDSYTNFITYLFDDNLNSTDISDRLFRRGVIIRDLASYGMNAIRVTVGTPEQNSIFFKNFKEVLN